MSYRRILPGLGTTTLTCLLACGAAAQTSTPRIVSAANTFLSTLDEKQRKSVQFAFDDEQQRVRWSNLPIRSVPRAGLSLGELSTPQRSAAMALLSSALSRRGLEKVEQVMEGDAVLKTNGRNNPMFGKDLFYISSWECLRRKALGCSNSAGITSR